MSLLQQSLYSEIPYSVVNYEHVTAYLKSKLNVFTYKPLEVII